MPETTAVNPEPIKPAIGEHAGFGVRLVAGLLDGFILLGITLILGVLFRIMGSKEVDSVPILVQLFIAWGYGIYFIGRQGATLGKKAMGLKVIKTDESNLSYGDAVMREVLGRLVSGITLGIGYLWVLWDPQKQALHDKIANTFVVKV